VIRPLGHRGRTTMPCSGQGHFILQFQRFALYVFECRKTDTLLHNFALTTLLRIMHFIYDTANATLPRLVDVAMSFSNQVLVVVLHILPFFGGLLG
jgi:hypothetical protein